MAEPCVAIIILNWNGLTDTLECLASLTRLKYRNFQIIVVDNGSKDGSVEGIRRRFPDVVLIENKENLGFSEGNNAGLRYALAGKTDHFLLINNDTVVDSEFLGQLVTVAEADATVGIVSPLIFDFARRDEIWTAGATINWADGSTRRLRAGELAGQDELPLEVDFVSGCALLAKREVIEKTGVLDPAFYLYYEETDWCVRAHKQGYRILCVPQARIWHKVSGSLGPGSPLVSYYMRRNSLLLLRKHLVGVRRIVALLRNVICAARSIVGVYCRRRNVHLRPNAAAQVRALLDFFRGRFGALRQPSRESL